MTARHVWRAQRLNLDTPIGVRRPAPATCERLSLVEDRAAHLALSHSALPNQDPHSTAGGRPPDDCPPCGRYQPLKGTT